MIAHIGRRGIRVIAVVLGIASATVIAQGQDARLAARLDARTAATVGAAIDSARVSGLPQEPLIQKALQGAAKGADGARITAAVSRLMTDMRTARRLLGPSATSGELEAGANAVRAGVRDVEITRLRATQPDRPLTTVLATLSDLVARGVPVDVASSVVMSLVERGTGDDDLVRLQQDVDRDVRAGVPASTAVVIRARATDANRPRTPSRRTRPADQGESRDNERTAPSRGGA
jgi:hypothetical protein